MDKNSKKIAVVILFVMIAAAAAGYFVFVKKQAGNGLKTFTFDTFHGGTNISDKFQFQYPANWQTTAKEQIFFPA